MFPTIFDDDIFDEYELHDPLNGIDYGPCNDFAPDSLGDNPRVCTTCFYHELDHLPVEKECGS